MRKTLFFLAIAALCGSTLAADADAAPTLAAVSPILNKTPEPAQVDAITIPRLISFQGRLTDPAGNPVPNGTYSTTFSLYTVAGGGAAYWTEVQNVTTTAGLFSILLGSVTPIPSVPDAGALYIAMMVSGNPEMTPRIRVASAPYAYKADSAGMATAVVADGVTATMIANNAVTMPKIAQAGATNGQVIKWNGSNWAPANDLSGGGEQTWVRPVTPDSAIYTVNRLGLGRAGATLNGTGKWSHVNLGINSRTGETGQNRLWATVGGGTEGDAWGNYSTVCGGYDGDATEDYSTSVGGYDCDTRGPYSAVLGGRTNDAGNSVDDTASTVVGGYSNLVNAKYSIVGGGYNNTVNGSMTMIGAGALNTADGDSSFIGAGHHNSAAGRASAVVGGGYNTATGSFSFVGGGLYNGAVGVYSVVGGGWADSAKGAYSTVAGGEQCEALGGYSAVGGGSDNLASGSYAVVAGGNDNVAGGQYSGVLGGAYDSVMGNYSAAFGRSIYTYPSDTCIVFFDSVIHGVLRMNLDGRQNNAPFSASPIFVGTSTHNGNSAFLTAGGVWTNGFLDGGGFERNPVDARELLARVKALEVQRLRDTKSGEVHIAPTVGSFYSAFDCGTRRVDGSLEGRGGIAALDVAGVSLVAVQELLRRVETQQAKIAELEARLAKLEGK